MRVYRLRWSSVSRALARTASEAQFESPAFRVREPSRSRFPFCRSVPVLDDLVARGCVGRLLCSGSVVHFQISSAAKFPQSGATARECLFHLVSCRRSLKTSSLRRFQPGSLWFGVFSVF